MEIKFNKTPDQIELIKAMGSKNPVVAREAMEAVASLLVPVVREVLLSAGTASKIYRDIEFDEDSDPSIPLDAFYGEGAGYVTVWSQNVAGGLPTSQAEGIKELKFGTYHLDSAFSFNKKYARKNRLDVISKYIERAINELVVRQDRNGWAVVLKALAEAKTQTASGTQLSHIITDTYSSPFMLSVLNALMVRIKRINESYSGNTPVQPYTNGITDMFVSPEVKAAIRAFSYNPINTTATASTGSDIMRNQYLTDDLRNDIYKNAGMQSIYGVNIIELLEFGKGQKYNKLFDGFATAASVANWASGGATTEIMVGVDNTRGVFVRPVAIQSESGGTITVTPDGQFDAYGSRVQKAGFYIGLDEGRLCLDARAVAGAVVTSA